MNQLELGKAFTLIEPGPVVLANIECRVVDIIEEHSIVVLEGGYTSLRH